MSKRKDIVDISSESKELLQRYIRNRMDAYKLDMAERVTKINTFLLIAFFFTFLGYIVLLFLSLAAALQIGDLLNSLPLGFIIMAGVWLLILLGLYAFRKKLIELPMLRWMIALMFQKNQ
ncbi:MAG: phage holin family protein [Chitinophagales bacterium]